MVDTGPPKIEIRSLNFYYGNVLSLNDINMTLADRCITAFIGPSGCGKSTLLRVLNRMYALYPEQRAEGEVLIGRHEHPGPFGGRRGTSLPGGHGVSEAHAVSDVGVR